MYTHTHTHTHTHTQHNTLIQTLYTLYQDVGVQSIVDVFARYLCNHAPIKGVGQLRYCSDLINCLALAPNFNVFMRLNS